jgi:hypothetical protein
MKSTLFALKPGSLERQFDGTILRPVAILGLLAFALFMAFMGTNRAYAQGESAVQELTGLVQQDGGAVYVLPDLKRGETLYFYLSGTSGNLDPLIALADDSLPANEFAETFDARVKEEIAAGADPLVAIPQVVDELFLAWDDDSGDGYDAALEFTAPADGDYLLAVVANPTQETFGDFRLLVGLDAPQVLTGEAESTGDTIAVLNERDSQFRVSVQELTDTLTAEKRSTFYTLKDVEPGDTLYVFAEATSGDLAPVVVLRDFGGKPIRSGNFLGKESQASFEFTFDEAVQNFEVNIEACCENGRVTEGDFRLLLGLNEPDVLTGAVSPTGETVVKGAIPVKIGLKMQQITSVDQKAENFGVVATVLMEWQDPALAFSPDECQCNFKTFGDIAFANFVTEQDIAWPEFTLFNQQGRRFTQNQIVVIFPDGEAAYFERFSATLQAPDFDFRRFPFDTQQFFIRIDSLFPEEFFVYSDLEGFSEVGEQLGEEEWIVTNFDTAITTELASTQRLTSRFSFGFEAERHVSFYITRLFIPILVILIVSWFTFFLKDYGKRVDVSAGNLLLFIAFNFTISNDLPRLGYLTFMDVVLISTFVVTGLVVIFNVILKRLEIAGKIELAQRIDRYTIWIYPLVYVAAIAIVTFFFT